MRPTLADHRSCLDGPWNRETPCRFRATSPRTCRDPSGSIDLDPSDLPGLRNNVHVMFSPGVHQTPDVQSHRRGMMRLRSVNWGEAMSYRIVFWSAVGWVVLCLAPYVYALNDLITWR